VLGAALSSLLSGTLIAKPGAFLSPAFLATVVPAVPGLGIVCYLVIPGLMAAPVDFLESAFCTSGALRPLGLARPLLVPYDTVLLAA